MKNKKIIFFFLIRSIILFCCNLCHSATLDLQPFQSFPSLRCRYQFSRFSVVLKISPLVLFLVSVYDNDYNSDATCESLDRRVCVAGVVWDRGFLLTTPHGQYIFTTLISHRWLWVVARAISPLITQKKLIIFRIFTKLN